mmetsp:Transcript_37569/g.111036  ORF Transcript_37569/g.111036 Transcript_37569/m.111036 type:complete len:270 (+) Transcript_37569:564-1373(+)
MCTHSGLWLQQGVLAVHLSIGRGCRVPASAARIALAAGSAAACTATAVPAAAAAVLDATVVVDAVAAAAAAATATAAAYQGVAALRLAAAKVLHEVHAGSGRQQRVISLARSKPLPLAVRLDDDRAADKKIKQLAVAASEAAVVAEVGAPVRQEVGNGRIIARECPWHNVSTHHHVSHGMAWQAQLQEQPALPKAAALATCAAALATACRAARRAAVAAAVAVAAPRLLARSATRFAKHARRAERVHSRGRPRCQHAAPDVHEQKKCGE